MCACKPLLIALRCGLCSPAFRKGPCSSTAPIRAEGCQLRTSVSTCFTVFSHPTLPKALSYPGARWLVTSSKKLPIAVAKAAAAQIAAMRVHLFLSDSPGSCSTALIRQEAVLCWPAMFFVSGPPTAVTTQIREQPGHTHTHKEHSLKSMSMRKAS